ncbi:hypothetical protein PInf_008936 [Phytophthora infestans]|nr:hypothetical protein PInf_008936 [Phytophthora infestans]
MVVFRRLAKKKLKSFKLDAMVVKAPRAKDTNEASHRRAVKTIGQFSKAGKTCLRRTLLQLQARFPKVTNEAMACILFDPRTKSSAKKIAAVGNVPRKEEKATYKNGLDYLRAEHRKVFAQMAKLGKMSLSPPSSQSSLLSQDVNSPLSSPSSTVWDDEDELLLGAPIRTSKTREEVKESEINARAESIMREWLEMEPEWLEVAQRQNPDIQKEDLSSAMTTDSRNGMCWSLLGLYKHVYVQQWFRDEGESLYPSMALLARIHLGKIASSAFQERVFSTGGIIMGRLRTRTDNRRSEKQLLLRHNRDEIVRLKQDARKVRDLERVNAFDAYEQGLIAHVRENLQAPAAEANPPHPKPIRLKVKPYEGKEGENLHFWVREVELAMDAALISTEQLRVAFALSNLSGRAKSWLCEQLRAAFLPASYEYRQRSHFLACKQGRRELHEYVQEIRELTASLVGNPLNEHIKMTVFMDGLRVGPARTQLFRVQASTLEEAIQPSQARTPASAWPGSSLSAPVEQAPTDQFPWNSGPPNSVTSAASTVGRWATSSATTVLPKPVLKGRWQKPGSRGQVNAGNQILIDSGASKNFARRQTVARNSNKLSEALRESKGNGTVSVRLADGKVVTVPNVQVDLAVEFEDFDSLEQFTVLDMDPYDMILGMPWLEKHEPWIDWRGKAIGASRPAQSDRALTAAAVMNTENSVFRVGNRVPLTVAQTITEEEDVGYASCVGNTVPHAVAQTLTEEEGVEHASCVGNTVPHAVAQTLTEEEGVEHAFCVGNTVPHAVARP